MAYHEIGHALVAARQTNSAPVQKITIVPRTSGALGYTMQVEEGNHYLGGDASLTCSAETQTKIDEEVVALVKTQYDKAMNILVENKQKLHELSKFLYEQETITGDEFMRILESHTESM